MQLELSSSEVKSNYIVYLHYASILKKILSKYPKKKLLEKTPQQTATISNYH